MKSSIIFASALVLFLTGCITQSRPPVESVRVSILYPKNEGARFDWAYYTEHHLPLVNRLLGSALKGVSIEEGLGGRSMNSPPTYMAMAHLTFESLGAYQAAMAPHATEIRADIPKFTTVVPVVQISKIRIAK